MANQPAYENHRLTRQGMLDVIANRGTVMHNGKFIRRPEDVPDDAALVEVFPERRAATKAALERQIADLTHKVNMLDQPSPDLTENLASGVAGHGEPGTNPVNPDLDGQRTLAREAEMATAVAEFEKTQGKGKAGRKNGEAPADAVVAAATPTTNAPAAEEGK